MRIDGDSLGLLGIVFIVLKLCGVINWSWWLVTAPLWGGLALFLFIVVGAGIGYLLGKIMRIW